MKQIQNIIIGAGPSGLAMAAHFEKFSIPYEIIEKQDRPGYMWHHHYDRLHLHTLKQHSALPYLPFPEDYPDYVPRAKVAEYLGNYAKAMNIHPQYNTAVKWISKNKDGKGWRVETDKATFLTENVIVATGQNRSPNKPEWPGMSDFQGEIIHSRNYRNGKAWKNKNALVIGIGNTGAELAMELYECGANSHISVRSSVNVVPIKVMGRSYQKSAIMLENVPNVISDFIGRSIQKLVVGDLSGYGLPKPSLAPAKEMRLHRKTPLIDIGTIDLIKQGHIKVLPDVKSFTKTGIQFSNGEELPFDFVLLATGYRCGLDKFLEGADAIVDDKGFPPHWEIPQTHPGLYFLGYMEFSSGLLRAVDILSKKILKRIQKQ